MPTKSLVPRANNEGKLGTSAKQWAEVNAISVKVNGSEAATAAAVTAEAAARASADAALVPQSRAITGAGLATGGGSLAADRTITVPAASQAQAEAGLADNVAMTPLRTAQAIAALAPTGGGGVTVSDDLPLSGASNSSTNLAANTTGLVTLAGSATHTLVLPVGSTHDTVERRITIAAGTTGKVIVTLTGGAEVFSTGVVAGGTAAFKFAKTAAGWSLVFATYPAVPGLVAGFAYAYLSDRAVPTAFTLIQDAIDAAKASGVGEVVVTPKFPHWDEAVQMRAGVHVHCLGGVKWHFTGLGTQIIEVPNAEAGQFKITGDADLRRILNNPALNGVAVACVASSLSNNLTLNAHGLTDGMRVLFNDSTTPPGGLTGTTPFFVVNAATNTFQVSTSLGGSAVDITTNGTNVLVRRIIRADIASIATASGVTTVTTTAAHGFPKYFSVTLAGTSTTPSLTTGTHRCTTTSSTTFTLVPPSGTPTQGAAAGTATYVPEEHLCKVRNAATHFDAHAEHFRIISAVPVTNSAECSGFHVTHAPGDTGPGTIFHARNHSFVNTNASMLHMEGGRVHLHAAGAFVGSGTGIATLVCDGNNSGGPATFDDPSAELWVFAFELNAGPGQRAMWTKGLWKNLFTHLEVQSVVGQIRMSDFFRSGVGSSVWANFVVSTLRTDADVTAFYLDATDSTAIVPSGNILSIDGPGATQSVVWMNFPAGQADPGRATLHIHEVVSRFGSASVPAVYCSAQIFRHVLRIDTFRHYLPVNFPIAFRLLGAVELQRCEVHNGLVEVQVDGVTLRECALLPGVGPQASSYPAIRAVRNPNLETTYDSGSDVLTTATAHGLEVGMTVTLADSDTIPAGLNGGNYTVASVPSTTTLTLTGANATDDGDGVRVRYVESVRVNFIGCTMSDNGENLGLENVTGFGGVTPRVVPMQSSAIGLRATAAPTIAENAGDYELTDEGTWVPYSGGPTVTTSYTWEFNDGVWISVGTGASMTPGAGPGEYRLAVTKTWHGFATTAHSNALTLS